MTFDEWTAKNVLWEKFYDADEKDICREGWDAASEAFSAELAACQAREAYLREVLEAQPRRLTTVWKDGIDLALPDYATRLRDQALAAPQDRTTLDEQIARAQEEGAERAALALERQHSWITNVAAATVARAAGRQP